jgi:3D (Asp-Asp-Asp) domain-containing protein
VVAGHRAGTLALTATLLMLAIGCAGRQPRPAQPATRPGTFVATAYCQGAVTASGARVRDGFVAADPAVLPLGTVIRVSGLERRYNRTYRVMDTGGAIRGRRIDLYIRNCDEAIRFGRRSATVSIVRRASARRQ